MTTLLLVRDYFFFVIEFWGFSAWFVVVTVAGGELKRLVLANPLEPIHPSEGKTAVLDNEPTFAR